MYTTKSGRKYGSAYVGKRHDAAEAEKESPKSSAGESMPSEDDNNKKRLSAVTEAPEDAKPEGHEPTAADEPNVPEHDNAEEGADVHPAVAEHGEPHTIVHKFDDENGRHSVTSHHHDGHTHMSVHPDKASAWEEGGKLANLSLKKAKKSNPQAGAASEGDNENVNDADGFVMPPLA
jgi:hypothetical protein